MAAVTEPPAAVEGAMVKRLRVLLAAGALRGPDEVRRLSPEERSALADLLNGEESRAAREADRGAAYEARRLSVARYDDLVTSTGDSDRALTLGELGFGVVRAGRGGRTIWASDAAQHRQAAHARAEAGLIRSTCIADALRDTRADARTVRIYELDEADVALAQEVGNAKADRIIAALAM
ncbi:hypothetical protein Q9S36_06890 [Microbacterium sp. ARD31]|uniref:hypothetical protein n=1 Tax=Microbacterium sp. ARD31 TaxID=2962576 RepID=UPI0028812E85|nr:hypothetical protein [Microbacterium sp. ARD31]MDT0179936.1 hypothetical protein [Microbacterium sp. ARD31]